MHLGKTTVYNLNIFLFKRLVMLMYFLSIQLALGLSRILRRNKGSNCRLFIEFYELNCICFMAQMLLKMSNKHFSKMVFYYQDSRNKSSVLGFQYEPENLFCFAKELDIPSTHKELRKSIPQCYGCGKFTQ